MQTLFIVMLAHRSSHSSRLSVGSLCVAGMPSSAAESDRAPGGKGGRERRGRASYSQACADIRTCLLHCNRAQHVHSVCPWGQNISAGGRDGGWYKVLTSDSSSYFIHTLT